MSPLVSLPAEIIIKILKLVALTNTQSLRNLCLVNKALNQICSPWLVYRWTNSKESPEPSLQSFALHLLKHPGLRSKVRIVDFGVLRVVPESSAETYSLELVALAECLREDVDFSTFHGWRDLLEGIKRGCEDAISVAVLAWCKQITHLTMTLPKTDQWGPNKFNVWGLKFANKACYRNMEIHQQGRETIGLPLAQLQYVELLPIDPKRQVYFEWTIPFIHHPKLKSLAAWRLCDEDAVKDIWDREMGNSYTRHTAVREKHVSNVEELNLVRAGHPGEGLYELLSLTRKLKKLTIQPCIDCYHYDMADYNKLAENIGLCRESLEELELIYSSTLTPFALLRDPVARKVYRKCTRLRRLTCPMDTLFSDGFDVNETWIEREITIDIERLPQSIEYLKPRRRHFMEKWYNDRPPVKPFIDGFIELLRQATPDGRLPNLTVLDFTDTFVDDPETDGIEQMKELAENQGVKLLMAQRQICGRNWDCTPRYSVVNPQFPIR